MKNAVAAVAGPILGRCFVGETVTQKVWARLRTAGELFIIYRTRDPGPEDPIVASFKMLGEPTNAGVCDLQGLKLDTNYRYMVGGLTAVRGHNLRWDDVAKVLPQFEFTTPSGSADTTKFIFGSCRHYGNVPWFRQGDAAFRKIRDNGNYNVDFILHGGDQVYIDHRAIPFSGYFAPNVAPKNYERYLKQYQKYYGQMGFAKVASSVPSYMILDDHEIANDWSAGRFFDGDYMGSTKRSYSADSFLCGTYSYLTHQAIFSPWADDEKNSALVSDLFSKPMIKLRSELKECRHSYQFEHGRCRFYVMDVRSERSLIQRERLSGADLTPSMISDAQLDEIETFLRANSGDKINFLVSPVPLFPDYTRLFASPDDIWTAYAEQREQLLNLIAKIADEKGDDFCLPIVLSGDVHHSLMAKLVMKTPAGRSITLHSIISSAFNWYIFGLNRLSIEGRGGPAPLITKWRQRKVEYSSTKVIQTMSAPMNANNFCVIEVDKDGITLSIVPVGRGKQQVFPIPIDELKRHAQ